MSTVYIISALDNVGTALTECLPKETASTVGLSQSVEVQVVDRIQVQHKIALSDIPEGANIIKYGMPIGYARRRIRKGELVHLENCASHFDERSNSLNAVTGEPTDTQYV